MDFETRSRVGMENRRSFETPAARAMTGPAGAYAWIEEGKPLLPSPSRQPFNIRPPSTTISAPNVQRDASEAR